jgi:hypothetical protein
MGAVFSQIRLTLADFLWPIAVMQEMLRIYPDALFWGIGALSLVTLSFSFFVFFVSLIEGIGIYYLIRVLNNHLENRQVVRIPSVYRV